jgi:uncharacterized oligopeptide transporter (OPT) family protein
VWCVLLFGRTILIYIIVNKKEGKYRTKYYTMHINRIYSGFLSIIDLIGLGFWTNIIRNLMKSKYKFFGENRCEFFEFNRFSLLLKSACCSCCSSSENYFPIWFANFFVDIRKVWIHLVQQIFLHMSQTYFIYFCFIHLICGLGLIWPNFCCAN